MNKADYKTIIKALHQEDLQGGMEWMNESSDTDKLVVWNAIQDMPQVGPEQDVGEIIARLAQIGFQVLLMSESGAGKDDN